MKIIELFFGQDYVVREVRLTPYTHECTSAQFSLAWILHRKVYGYRGLGGFGSERRN